MKRRSLLASIGIVCSFLVVLATPLGGVYAEVNPWLNLKVS